MQDEATASADREVVPKPPKRKTQKSSKIEALGNNTKRVHEVMHHQQDKKSQKGSKRGLKNDKPQMLQQPEKSTSDSLPDSSTGNEYRSLRRKYLLLEEESFNLGKELRDVQGEVNSLEEEKLSLLDELIVLEGLIDPLELIEAKRRLP